MLKHATFILRYAILFIGAAMMTIGVLYGELDSILAKAVVVCLECIGLG